MDVSGHHPSAAYAAAAVYVRGGGKERRRVKSGCVPCPLLPELMIFDVLKVYTSENVALPLIYLYKYKYK